MKTHLSIVSVIVILMILGGLIFQATNNRNDTEHNKQISALSQDLSLLQRAETTRAQREQIEMKEQQDRDTENDITAQVAQLESVESEIDQKIEREFQLRRTKKMDEAYALSQEITLQQALAENLKVEIERLKSTL